jgi:hypothetical protein
LRIGRGSSAFRNVYLTNPPVRYMVVENPHSADGISQMAVRTMTVVAHSVEARRRPKYAS